MIVKPLICRTIGRQPAATPFCKDVFICENVAFATTRYC